MPVKILLGKACINLVYTGDKTPTHLRMGKSKNIPVRTKDIRADHSEEPWAAQQWFGAEERLLVYQRK